MSNNKGKETRIKITVGKARKKNNMEMGKSGPRMNDIRKKTTDRKKMPVKNIVKIKEEKSNVLTSKKYFYRGLFFVVLGIIILILISFYAYWQFLAPQDKIADLIPEEAPLYGKVDIGKIISNDSKNIQPEKIITQFDFLLNNVVQKINEEIFDFGINFTTDIEPFIGNNLAFSYIKNGGDNGFVFIVEVDDKEFAFNTLEKIEYKAVIDVENYEGIEIANIAKKDSYEKYYLTLFDNFMVLSKKRSPITSIIDTYKEKRLSLSQSQEYKKLSPFILFNKLFYLYTKPSEITELVPGNDNIKIAWEVITNKINAIFLFSQAAENGLQLDLSADYRHEGSRVEKISKDLIESLPLETSGFIAGKNLAKDFSELKDDLISTNPALEFYYTNLVSNFEEKSRAELDDGLLNYFANEYLVSIDYSVDKINFNFLIELSQSTKATDKIEEIEEAISNYLGNMYPKKEKMILSDGTETFELLPDKDSFKFEDMEFEGLKVRSITNPEISHNFSYVIMDNKLLASTSLGSLKNMLSARQETNKIINKRYFNYPYSKVAGWRNENIIYLNTKDLGNFLQASKNLEKYLQSIDNIILSTSSGKDKLFLKGFLYLEP